MPKFVLSKLIRVKFSPITKPTFRALALRHPLVSHLKSTWWLTHEVVAGPNQPNSQGPVFHNPGIFPKMFSGDNRLYRACDNHRKTLDSFPNLEMPDITTSWIKFQNVRCSSSMTNPSESSTREKKKTEKLDNEKIKNSVFTLKANEHFHERS